MARRESAVLARGSDRQLLTCSVIHRHGAGEGIRTLAVQLGKLGGQCHKPLAAQGDTTAPPGMVPRMVPCEPENEPNGPGPGADRRSLTAHLLADLPESERLQVIAAMLRELPPEDSAKLAEMLSL